jgi:hypothetical protein
MNDPHVEALHYRIKHAPDVDYERAEPLKHEEPSFSVSIENGEAKIGMKDHYLTVQSARAAVEPFLHAWELSWGLCYPKEKFEYVFLRGDLIDRKPAPAHGVLPAEAGLYGAGGQQSNTHHRRAKYPDPPQDLGWSADVDMMFERFRRINEEHTTLNDGANFCLTVLESAGAGPRRSHTRGKGGRRAQAAKYFGIDIQVLDKIGELAAEKGGRLDARKVEGVASHSHLLNGPGLNRH